MAFSVVSSASTQTTSSTSHSVTIPSTTVNADDIILGSVSVDDTNPSLPSGFTEIGSHTSGEIRTRFFYKVAVGGEEDDVVTSTSSAESGAIVIAVLRGLDTSAIAKGSGANTNNGISLSPASTQITGVASGDYAFSMVSRDGSMRVTPHSGMTELIDQDGINAGNGTGIWYEELSGTTAGAYTHTLDDNYSSDYWVCSTLVIGIDGGGASIAPVAVNHLKQIAGNS